MRVTLTRSQFMKLKYSFSIEVVSFLNVETNRILKSRRLMTVSEKRSYQNMPFSTLVAYEKECSQGMHGQPCEYRVDDEGKKKVDRPTKCCMAY